MYLRINSIPKKEEPKVWLAYYKFFENMYGKTLFGCPVKKFLLNNVEISPIIITMDNNLIPISDIIDIKSIKK